MARLEHKQLEQKSCGASAIMCTVKEFSLPMNWDDPNANRIYLNIQKGMHDESLISKMVAELRKHGLKVQLIEDVDRTGVFKSLPAFSVPYSDYLKDVASASLTIETRKSPDPFNEDDFKASARIIGARIPPGSSRRAKAACSSCPSASILPTMIACRARRSSPSRTWRRAMFRAFSLRAGMRSLIPTGSVVCSNEHPQDTSRPAAEFLPYAAWRKQLFRAAIYRALTTYGEAGNPFVARRDLHHRFP